MKRALIGTVFLSFVLVWGIALCYSDSLDTAPAWYFKLSGAAQGSMKLQFDHGTLTGAGATKGGGVMAIQGSYSFVSESTFSGSYSADGDFLFETGTFQGTVSKKGDKVTMNLLSDVGDRYTAKGTLTPPNIMISGTFNIVLSGDDQGSFTITSGNSGMPDLFYLSGSGETEYNGTTFLSATGYCDGKGNMYGSWSVDGEALSTVGTFSGKFKDGKISAKCVSVEGYVYSIKN